MSNKIKVGDTVIVNGSINNVTFENDIGVVKVVVDGHTANIGVEFDDTVYCLHSCHGHCKPGHGYYVREDMVKKLEPIVIYADGRQIVALDKNTGKKGVANCHPDDKFNAYIGAKIALDRLVNPKPDNFKVLAVKNSMICARKGNVYEFVNGVTTWSNGATSGYYESFEDFIKQNPSYAKCFVLLKDGDDPKKILEKHSFYNGRIVFTEQLPDLTKGKIYEIKDGKLTNDRGHVFPIFCRKFKTFDNVSEFFGGKVIEIRN